MVNLFSKGIQFLFNTQPMKGEAASETFVQINASFYHYLSSSYTC